MSPYTHQTTNTSITLAIQHQLSEMPHSAKEPPTMAVSPSTALSKDALLSPDFDPKHMRLIIQEGILIGAGAATILLQVAEPGVGQGVDEYSNFAYRPQDRLRTTMTFVYCMTHGTPAEKHAIIDMYVISESFLTLLGCVRSCWSLSGELFATCATAPTPKTDC